MTDRLETLTADYTPNHGVLKRDLKRDYEGEPIDDCTGDYHMCYWIEQGSPHKPAILSRDICSGSRKYMASCEYLDSISPITEKLAAVLHAADPEYYSECMDIMQHMPPGTEILNTCNGDPFTGKAILVNKRTLLHRDLNDVKHGLAIMCVYGKFIGGEFCLPDLGIKVRYQPGDLIVFRSYMLNHFIASWSGDFRYTTVYFNSASVFE
jgi:hypothetical protein